MRRAAILQSNYIPWRGYFQIIAACQAFVIYDDVQYTKNDWRNRNIIKTPQGPQWLTVPVAHTGKFGQPIDAVRVADRRFARKHWQALLTNYAKAPCFEELRPDLEELYRELGEEEFLSGVNRRCLDWVIARLGLTTALFSSRDFDLPEDRNERLVALCRALGADTYLSGPAAQSYLDLALFEAAGIAVEWVRYDATVTYPQLHGPFLPNVTVLDTLLNVGPAACRALVAGR